MGKKNKKVKFYSDKEALSNIFDFSDVEGPPKEQLFCVGNILSVQCSSVHWCFSSTDAIEDKIKKLYIPMFIHFDISIIEGTVEYHP